MTKRSKSAAQPFEKAGLFLYGKARDVSGRERVHTIVPYTEGRLSDHEKCYGLAKGVIDPGETPIQAAVRETKEETGVDLEKMLGRKAYADFCAGKPITNLRSPGYKGVVVRKADPTAIEHTYISSHGKPHKSAYFAIELAGIENLHSLKRMDEREHADLPNVLVPAKSYVSNRVETGEYPDFPARLRILETGVVRWKGVKPELIIEKPCLPEILQKHPVPTSIGDIHKLKNWVLYWNTLPDDARALLKKDLELIKDNFEKRGMIGDAEGLKFDGKQHPGVFYQEGGELLPVGTWLARSAKVAANVNADNPYANDNLYAKSMWGDTVAYPGISAVERMSQAQIAPAIEFFAKVAPEEIRDAGREEGIHSNRYLERAREMVAKLLAAVKPEDGTWSKRVRPQSPARIVAANAR